VLVEKGSRLGFEIIDIRRFEPKEFSALLEAEGRAWDNRLRWDFSASARVIIACFREQRLSGYTLVVEGRIRGYCFFFYDGEKGVIGDLFLHPEVAGQDGERLLLEHTLETLLATPGLHRIEAQLPHYGCDQLAPYFQPCGFESYLRHFMSVPLNPWRSTVSHLHPRPAVPALREDIELIAWDPRYQDEAGELLYQAYRRHIDARINNQYTSLLGTTRLLENISNNQGCGDFLPEVSRMAVVRPTHRLAGILTITCVRSQVAHIPQVGVSPAFQGLGVGTALMDAAFSDLAQEGYNEVTLTVTDANSGALRLYDRLGFRIYQSFGAFIYDRDPSFGPS